MTRHDKVLLENADAGWTKRIACNSVQVTMSRNNNTGPDLESGVVAEPTENSFENPKYNLQGWQLHPDVTYSAGDGALTINDLQSLHTQNGTELYLIVQYGASSLPGGQKTLSSVQSAYTDKIPVVIDQVQFNISTSESNAGYQPTGSITLTEDRGPNTTV